MDTTSFVRVGLNGPAHYLNWGPVQISVANLIVILLIVALFALAIAVPFPKGKVAQGGESAESTPSAPPATEDAGVKGGDES